MLLIKAAVLAVLFVLAYAVVDFIAGVTAPVLGPIVIVVAMWALLRIIWKLAR